MSYGRPLDSSSEDCPPDAPCRIRRANAASRNRYGPQPQRMTPEDYPAVGGRQPCPADRAMSARQPTYRRPVSAAAQRQGQQQLFRAQGAIPRVPAQTSRGQMGQPVMPRPGYAPPRQAPRVCSCNAPASAPLPGRAPGRAPARPVASARAAAPLGAPGKAFVGIITRGH